MNTRHRQSGSIIVSILIVTLFLFTVVSGLIVLANSNLSRAKGRIYLLQAQYAAESGADVAVAQLNADPAAAFTGSSETTILDNAQYRSTFTTTVTAGATSNERIITATGKVYRPRTATTAEFIHKVEVKAQRTSSSLVVEGMLSRNIIEIASSVKDVYAKELYVNGYIKMNKNTNKLHAESLTVSGKNTGPGNCSIGGTGNLVKPATFTDPAQTKTQLNLAYNNCITPPGNVSNSDFDVAVNQASLGKIQSTYIPWSQYMDGTYTSSYNACSDWTTGAFPRTIPSAGHTKQTHYPDSGSNVSTACGTSGDLALASGQYDITDNVHIRAHLCAAAECTPTFYNPTATVRYIFVEGTVNFGGVNTAAGSGPIVLIAYGADPASKASLCPLGGAIFLGNSGQVSAPQMYFLAINGLCFDKTKFGTNPGFGGISGKNIYLSTNAGSPFDPQLNTNFPFDAVPIDLAWHASQYRRL